MRKALWRIDTPSFMQPAMRQQLKSDRLEHKAYDKAADMLLSMHRRNDTWRTMSGAANKARRAFLSEKKQQEKRLGVHEE